MQRILLGLILITGAMGAMAVGSTSAFFSDTETSTGNTFTAGAIDLKIDHTKQTYNDSECELNCVEVEGDLAFDAKFENPVVATPQQWNVYDSPVAGWTVEWRSDIPASFGPQVRPTPAHLEIHRGVLGAADEGQQYAELDSDWGGPTDGGQNEPASVTMYRTIPTVIGKKYRVSFAFAPRPNTGAADNRLEVRWGGDVKHDTGNVGDPNAGITWTTVTFDTDPATTTATQLRFTDLGTANSLGTFLDDVRVVELNCDTTNIVGGQCKLWEEKDLSEGDTFWNFNDVKPGDRGTNVISLHVYDNDAFACMLTQNVTDNENTPIEPEVTAGDNLLNGIPNGELSQFVELFIWGDDGDGNYEPGVGEDSLYQGGFQNVAMDRLPLAATTTAYVGVAWCFGDQSVNNTTGAISCDGSSASNNVAQTDILMADLQFYAVQQRNNASFQCTDVPQGGNEEVVDLCPNLVGNQTQVPEGLILEGGLCVLPQGGDGDGDGDGDGGGLQTSLIFEKFGTGNDDTTFNEDDADEDTWVEGGAGAEKRNSSGGGDESIGDGDGGRKAAVFAGGYICKAINATNYTNLQLSYYWRGDSDAEAGDNGVVEYALGSDCNAIGATTGIATHPLTTTSWQTDNTHSLNAVNGQQFMLIFRNAANTAGEDFRVDRVVLSGTSL